MAASRFSVTALACSSMLVVLSCLQAAAASPGIDRLGIKEIYATKPGGMEWIFNATDPRDGLTISPAATTLHADSDSVLKIGRETGRANTGFVCT